MKFQMLALVSSALSAALALAWMFTPSLILKIFGMELSTSASAVGRRGGALFAGLSVILFMMRNMPEGTEQTALRLGFGLSCALLAILGSMELFKRNAGKGILLAIVTEIALAMVFLI